MDFIKKIPRITRNILILNIIMFFITPFIPEDDFMMMVGHSPFSSDFNLIQPLTSMFLHGGFMHLGMNMLMILNVCSFNLMDGARLGR